jgi:tetratricopeptide (TPR) repeat protein
MTRMMKCVLGPAAAALVLLAPLVAGAQQDARAVYLKAREDLIEERYEAALTGFRRVVTEMPESAEADDAQFYTGYVLERLGRTDQAVAAYAELIRRWPESPRAASARERQVALMGAGRDPAYAGALESLLESGLSWEMRREVAMSLARRGDLTAVDVLEEIMRRESTSRQIDLVNVLGERMQESAARRIVLSALEPGHATSVQLKALEVLAPVAAQPEVAAATARLLEEENSSSVQLKAVQVLRPHLAVPAVRTALARALAGNNSSSVQTAAVEALGVRMLEPEAVDVVRQVMESETSSSVQLKILSVLEARRDDPAIAPILAAAARTGNTSSVQAAAMRIARVSSAAEVRATARVGLTGPTSSSVQLEAVRALATGRDEASSAAALYDLFRSGGISSSVQLEAIDALARHMKTASGPPALAEALKAENSTSVQLKAVELASRHTADERVRAALTRLVTGEVSTNVQLAVVEQLRPYREEPEVRRVIIGALRRQNSTSVQLKAVEILAGKEDQEDVRVALVGSLDPERSTSVILAIMDRLDPWVERDRQVGTVYLRLMEHHDISSTARVRAAQALLPGADNRMKTRIVEAMEDVIILQARQRRFGDWNRELIRDAIEVVRRIDPERADRLAERYLKPPSLLERLLPPWGAVG